VTRGASLWVASWCHRAGTTSSVHRRDGRIVRTEQHRAVVAVDESSCPGGVRIAPLAESSEPVTVRGTGGAPREPPPPDTQPDE